MKNGSKRFLSVVLAVFMLLSLCVTMAEAATYSGDCGEDLTWSLNTVTGVLDITGTGEMEEYYYDYHAPWLEYASQIKTLNLPDGLTCISYMAFEKCTSLTSAAIPGSVTQIGDSAFDGCESLTSLTLPDGLEIIGSYAFYDCKSLKNLTLPDSLESIGSYAFCGCESITGVTIGVNVEDIGDGAFSNCSGLRQINYNANNLVSCGSSAFKYTDGESRAKLIVGDSVENLTQNLFYSISGKVESMSIGKDVKNMEIYSPCWIANINVSPENQSYSSQDGVLFNKNKSVLILYPAGSGSTNYTIPDSVSSIEPYAFYYCDSDFCVIVNSPDSLAAIEEYARQSRITYAFSDNKIKLDAASKTLILGQSFQLKYTLSLDENESVSWSSSNTDVATVDYDGNVTAVTVGTAVITAKTAYSNNADSCVVTVAEVPAEDISVNVRSAKLAKGSSFQLEYSFSNESTDTVTYSSSNNAVATVSEDGAVTAVDTGDAVIAVKAKSGATATCAVSVATAPALGANEVLVSSNPIITFETCSKCGGAGTTTCTLCYGKGRLYGFIPGTMTTGWYTCMAGGCGGGQVRCSLCNSAGQFKHEQYPATSIHITLSDVTMSKDMSVRLSRTVYPTNSTESVTWSSSNTSVATVDNSGVVTSVGDGTAVITATTASGATASSTVTVSAAPVNVPGIKDDVPGIKDDVPGIKDDVPGVKGDVTGDGKITAADARMSLRASANLETLSPDQIAAADVNGDGKITAADARTILRVSANLQSF